MQDLDEIRERMAKRHHSLPQTKILGDKQFKFVYRLAMVSMSFCVLGLGMASYMKQNPQSLSFVQDYFDFNWFENHVLNVIPFFGQNEKEQSVNTEIAYELIGEKLYRGSNHEIRALGSGIVTAIESDCVVVNQDNGISATYGKLSEIKVALYDHIVKGEIIASYDQQFSMVFMEDGKEVPYEKAVLQN